AIFTFYMYCVYHNLFTGSHGAIQQVLKFVRICILIEICFFVFHCLKKKDMKKSIIIFLQCVYMIIIVFGSMLWSAAIMETTEVVERSDLHIEESKGQVSFHDVVADCTPEQFELLKRGSDLVVVSYLTDTLTEHQKILEVDFD
ncbi:MAG: hypothetical protein Q4B70_16890, partial [Lachnospiraceae bacterium]|nr:hypothetical protein [Lachnospiraceae bacterium]